jgi:transposase
MARRSKSKGTRRKTKLNIIHTRAAGIDVGATFHVVAVPPELSPEPVQAFQSFTGDLYRLADWLVEIGGHDRRHGVHRHLLDSGL